MDDTIGDGESFDRISQALCSHPKQGLPRSCSGLPDLHPRTLDRKAPRCDPLIRRQGRITLNDSDAAEWDIEFLGGDPDPVQRARSRTRATLRYSITSGQFVWKNCPAGRSIRS